MGGSDNNLELNVTEPFLLKGSKCCRLYLKKNKENIECYCITRMILKMVVYLQKCLNISYLKKLDS